jgi:hypothetical protein
MRKPMNQLWRVVIVLALVLTLPLRAQSGPLRSCCIAVIAEMSTGMPVRAANVSVETGSSPDCISQSSCADNRNVSGPSGLPCTASACAVLAGMPVSTGSVTGAWISVLVAHPEFSYQSAVPPRLERPPK